MKIQNIDFEVLNMKDNQLYKNIKKVIQDHKIIAITITSIVAVFFIYNMGFAFGKLLYYITH
ncbi:hypothetical protein LOR37_15725 [Clostridium estertheticum]|uniref:hypothetical protein n=1 Tax=Clostridium estertheticum TaxID=238834 RepID=UPI0022DCF20F|nr:hypothetical protein [Clostridium estertheticum]WBL46118.1 hypothetical protein LOR37_15725 [Clostridium estertheticum]